jgi:type II secretory pathway component PulK
MNGQREARHSAKKSGNERGVALLLVLFVISLLIIIAAEFAFTTRMEINVVSNFRDDMEGYYFGLAGFQYALTEIIGNYDDTYLGPEGQIGFYRKWYQDKQNQSTPIATATDSEETVVSWPPLPNRSGIPIGEGMFDYVITDEEGRINLNYLDSNTKSGPKTNREIFRELLVQTGVDDGEQADIIIDSILDWIDRNDEHHLNGAEDDWYQKNYKEQGFSEPYHCKNGKLDTIDELLMIRGISPAILYGSNSVYAQADNTDRTYLGIQPYITVFGFQRAINQQTAPPLLMQIMNPDDADQLLENRSDFNKATKKPSRTFRVEVRGYKANSRVSHYIMAVVRRSNGKLGGGSEVLFWNDSAPGAGMDLGVYSASDEEVQQ